MPGGTSHCDDHARPAWAGSERDMPTNSAQWHHLRAFVLERDGAVCWWCGLPGADTVDHLIPQVVGGSSDPSNLGPIHASVCHDEKTRADRKGVPVWLTRNGARPSSGVG